MFVLLQVDPFEPNPGVCTDQLVIRYGNDEPITMTSPRIYLGPEKQLTVMITSCRHLSPMVDIPIKLQALFQYAG